MENNLEEMTTFEVDNCPDDDNPSDEELSVTERDTWGGELEFVLSLVGYTVGLSNIWRFPYYCFRNGGGSAIIPFLLFLVVCGGPLYYMEICLGQFSGKSPIKVWNLCPLFKGIGLTMAIISLLGTWYFGVVFGWVIYYLIQSFYPTLPWTSCSNSWNTELCIDSSYNITERLEKMTDNLTGNPVTFQSPVTEFWEHNVLHKSTGINDVGSLQLHVMGCVFLGWFLVFLCLIKGVKSLGKVVYVTVSLPYVLLTVLLIRGVTLDGAWDGLRYYFIPDFSKLLNGQVWVEAAIQCFFSLGPAWGGGITMASFNKFNHNALRDTVIVCFMDAFTAIYGGIVVFSVIGFLSKQSGTPFEELPIAGPQLAFIAYPEVLRHLPAANIWSVLFFLTLVFVGIDSQFVTFETALNSIIDLNYKKLHRYRMWMSVVLVVVICVMSLPFTTSGGIYVFILVDWYIATFNIAFTALFECIVVAWIYGANRFSSDIEIMRGTRPSLMLRIIWCFIIPAFIVVLLTMAMSTYTLPVGAYSYPSYAIVLGNILAFGPLSAIFLIAIVQLVVRSRASVNQRSRSLLRPSSCWCPNDAKQRTLYRLYPYQYESGIWRRVCVNIIGLKQRNE